MTHREMVALTPRHAMTLTREQMEAHLTLHGWEPFNVGQGAALKDGLVVYTLDERVGGHGTGRVSIRQQTLEGMNLMERDMKAEARKMHMWYMSAKYFWPLAHACTKRDSAEAAFNDPNMPATKD